MPRAGSENPETIPFAICHNFSELAILTENKSSIYTADYCFQSFRLVFSSFQRLGQKPQFLSQLVYLLELHDIQHREQDAVYLGIPTLVEVTVIPVGHWMPG